MSGSVILPWFAAENHETIRPWLSFQEMATLLERLKFKIKQTFDLDGQLLNRQISLPPPNHVRFEVALPEGWRLVAGFDGYGQPDGSHALLDDQGRYRGDFDAWNEELAEGIIFCRYALNPPNAFRAVPQPRDHITDVVVDNAAVDYRRPADFPVVMFHHSRRARTMPIIDDKFVASFAKTMEEDAERVRAGKPNLATPALRWLHKKYPEWRNPVAYW